MKHKDQVGANAIHQSAYVQDTDPGAVGALKDWYDTTADPAIHKVRNITNDGWLVVGAAGTVGADLAAHISDASGAHEASAISFTPAGTIAATHAQAAIEEVASEASAGGTGLADHLADASGAHAASAISYSGSANLAATDVEGALDELDTEKASATSVSDHLADAAAAHAASAISFTPAGTVAATTVQGAIEEVASEAGGGGGSGYAPPWVKTGANTIFSNYGDGDPGQAAFLHQIAPSLGNSALSPTGLGTNRAVGHRFRLPYDLAVGHIRAYPIGATTNLFRFGIYPATPGSTKLWDSGTFTTAPDTWLDITASTPFTLTADTDYWFFAAVVATSVTSVFRVMPSAPAASSMNFWGASAAPLGGLSIGLPEQIQIAVTTGVLPSTLPSLVAMAGGPGAPFAWLEGTAS